MTILSKESRYVSLRFVSLPHWLFVLLQDEEQRVPTAAASNVREPSQRALVPTEVQCSNLFEAIWNYTARMRPQDRNTARILIHDRLTSLQTEIRSKHTEHVPRTELTRNFSRGDIMWQRIRKMRKSASNTNKWCVDLDIFNVSSLFFTSVASFFSLWACCLYCSRSARGVCWAGCCEGIYHYMPTTTPTPQPLVLGKELTSMYSQKLLQFATTLQFFSLHFLQTKLRFLE